MYSHHNLANTVENRPRYETAHCTVPHKKTSGLYYVLAAEDGDDSHIWDHCHKWSDHAGGIKGGICEKCGKTLKQVRVRVNPKTGQPLRRNTIAREIAMMPRDVPPVRFIQGPR